MDNEEFRIKMDEINTLVNKQDYKAAMKIADGINWKKVKSAKTLSTVAEIYVKNKKYKESMEIFLLAYHRAGIGKSILIRLIEISIAANSLSDAEDFFKEFRQIAPNDSTRYVLEYEILKAKNAPLSNQISVLERYNDREFTEKWSYELAKLYYQVGDEQNCIDTCNKMILWFYDGEYVMKAMELKKNLNALTEDESIRYESNLESMSFTQEDKEALRENIEENSQEDQPEDNQDEVKKEETAKSKENQDEDLDDDELEDLEDLEEEKKPGRFKISFFGKKDKGNKKKDKGSKKREEESDDDLLNDLDNLDDIDDLNEDDLSENDKKEEKSSEESAEEKKEGSEDNTETVEDVSDEVSGEVKEANEETSELPEDVKEEVKPEKSKKKKSNIVRENFSDDDDDDDDEFDDFNEEEFIHELEGTSGRGSIGKDFQSKIAKGLRDIFKGKKKGLSNNLLDDEDISEQVITSGKPDDAEEVKKLEDDLDDFDDLDGIDLDRILEQELEEESSEENEEETEDVSEESLEENSEEVQEEEVSEEAETESEEEENNHSPYSDDSLAIDINEIMEIMNDKKKEKEEEEEKKRKEEAEEEKEPEFNMEEMILNAATEQGIDIGIENNKEESEVETEEESEEDSEEEVEEVEEENEEESEAEAEEESEEESEVEVEEENKEESEVEAEAENEEDSEVEAEEEPEEEAEEDSEVENEEESEAEAEEENEEDSEAEVEEESEEESEEEAEEENEEEAEETSEEELEEELEEEFEDNETEEESEEEPEEDSDHKVKKNGLNLSILRKLNEKIGRKLSTKKVEKQEEPEEETASIKVPSVKDSVFQDVEKLEEESVIDNVFNDYENTEDEDADLIEDTITLDVPKVTEEEIDEASEDEDSLYEKNEFEDNELGEIEEESEEEINTEVEEESVKKSEEESESEEIKEDLVEVKKLETEEELESEENESEEMSEEQKLEMIMDYQSSNKEQRDFTEKEKAQFKYFVKVPGMKEQIIEMLSQVKENYEDKTSLTGNIIVMGASETGKTSLISMIIPAICSELNMEATKVAYVFAEQINGKNMAKIVSRMSGGFFVIEEASKLNEKSVEELNKAMEFRTDGMIVILEDDKIKMRKFLVKYPEFAKKFNSILNIPVFTNEELVYFATYYTKENGFFIDQLGMVSLYKKINRSQKADEPLTVGNVEKLVQEAMDKAQKKKLFSKRKLTEDGLIILGEKDFN